ncbi:MFS general substrate transporter [Eremomyces bilateralis CBS 781.70]|uniref:MFS general substrate transporter n=1 Tax=Eremomyces bilateralis CBS 781.70 TaxID=1392243 RepID=A0A6G1G7R5_9PEZI|nr:MFS general substrate transporter [Eremomyces bilateralis CBS 781.70]KAF1813976.1 MFS general substrate transporter [Eremomyces bilateralis CBS 781.70]
MFIVARFFAGMGSWGFLAVTPVYSAELAPPGLRGLFVGMNGVNIALGYGLASYMGMAFYYADNDATKWRGPLGMALVWPFMMLAILPFIPESPRYLLMKNQVEKARDIVLRLHSTEGDDDQVFARSEFYQMQKQTEHDQKMDMGWLDMVRKPGARSRTALAMGFAFIGQSTAVLVINNYGPSLYGKLGFGTEDQLRFQCGWITVGVIFNLVGALIMDKLGRRPLMLFGVAGCCVCLILEAAMVASFAEEGTNKAGLGMGVAAFYLFLAVYSVGVDVAGVVFYGELFPNHQRGKGLSLSVATIALTDLVYLQATATAFANIGWKFYLVFIIITGLGAIVLYFVLPETKGIPLEEMAKIFGDADDVVVFAEDIHVDQHTHDLVVEDHKTHITHVATETGRDLTSGEANEKQGEVA